MASVLIVDDERSIRLTLGAFLMAAGHDVSVADDLGPALDVVANSELPLDVVVTDILLTTGSGLDILDAVRDRRPHVHVVLMTGQPTLASAGKAIRGRAFDYLAKPVSKETLLDVVERAAAAKSRAEEFERLQAEREQYRHRLEQEVAERTAALAAGEARYRLLVEHQTDLIVKFDLKQRILYASPSYCRTFGRSAEELVGEKFTPLIHEEDRAAVSASLALALEPPYMTRHEERALTVDGWRWFEWLAHGVPDDDGEVRSVVATGRDITEVKSARASLEESERKFRTLVDQVGEALFLHAPDGTLLDVNARAVARYGYTREELLALTVSDIDPDCSERGDPARFWETLDVGDRVSFEARHLTRTGECFPVELTMSIVELEGERRILVLARDISRRRRVREELRRRQALLDQTQRTARIGGWQYTPGTGEVCWTPEMYRLHGLAEDEDTDLMAVLLAPYAGAAGERAREALERCVREGVPFDLELRARGAEEADAWLRITGTAETVEGKVERVTGTVMDVTDCCRAELQLADIAAHVPGAIYQFVLHADGHVSVPFMSEGAAELFGRPRADLMDSSCLFDDVHQDDRERLWDSIRDSAASGRRWEQEFRILPKSGGIRWLRAVSNPRTEADGTVVWNGMIYDVSDRYA